MANQYVEQRDEENYKLIDEICDELPYYVRYFIEDSRYAQKSTLTKVAYLKDLRIFFNFLAQNVPSIKGTPLNEITLEQLDSLTLQDFNSFINYIKKGYYKPEKESDKDSIDPKTGRPKKAKKITNSTAGIARKMVSVRMFYKIMYKQDLLKNNIAERMEVPTPPSHEVIYFTKEEIAKIKETIRNGFNTSKKQGKFLENTRTRDMALISVLLATGIRASECVGLDLDHINHYDHTVFVTRKGAKTMSLKLNESSYEDLCEYIKEREKITPAPGHEKALFLSSQKKRISARSLQNIVKKYTQAACPYKPIDEFKKFSPHKLRASFATNLYENTHDIEKVANRLGHSGLGTVKHYVKYNDDNGEDVDW